MLAFQMVTPLSAYFGAKTAFAYELGRDYVLGLRVEPAVRAGVLDPGLPRRRAARLLRAAPPAGRRR